MTAPLRERLEEFPFLVGQFLERLARELTREVVSLSGDALEKLKTHGWPGDELELRSVIERAVLLGSGPEISAEDIVFGRSRPPRVKGTRLLTLPVMGLDMADLHRDLVVQALERASGDKRKAAALLGLTRDKIQYRMEKYGLLGSAPRPDSTESDRARIGRRRTGSRTVGRQTSKSRGRVANR